MNQEHSLFHDKKKYWSSIAFLLLLIALTAFLLFRDYSPQMLLASLSRANPLYLIGGLFVMFAYISCEAFNTRRIMASLGKKLSLHQCLKYALIGFYFCAITPSATGGQPAQVYYMKKDGIPVGFSTLTLLVNLAIYQIMTLVCGIAFFLWKREFILASIQGLEPLFLLGLTIYLIALVIILGAIFSHSLIKRIFYGLVNLGVRCKVIKEPEQTMEKVDQQLAEYARCVAHIRKHPRLLAYNFLITLLQLLCYFSIPYFVYLAFHLSAYSLWDIVAIQVTMTVSVSALPLPGAVGVSEGSFLRMFHLFFGAELLLPALCLTRCLNFYVMLIFSGVIAVMTHWRTSKMPIQ